MRCGYRLTLYRRPLPRPLPGTGRGAAVLPVRSGQAKVSAFAGSHSERAGLKVGRTFLSAHVAVPRAPKLSSRGRALSCHPEPVEGLSKGAPQADEGSTAAWDQPQATCTWRYPERRHVRLLRGTDGRFFDFAQNDRAPQANRLRNCCQSAVCIASQSTLHSSKDIRLKEKGSPPMTSAQGALSNGGVVGGVVFT